MHNNTHHSTGAEILRRIITRAMPCLVAGLIGGAANPICARAANTPATVAPATRQTGAADIKADLKELNARINARALSLKKADGGSPAEADFAGELAEFDALISNNPTASPDDLASVLMQKSNVYKYVFKDYDQAAKILMQLKAAYPKTQAGAMVDNRLDSIKRARAAASVQQALQPGVVFPDFSAKSTTGQNVSPAKLKGKIVLMDFWATWCGPCTAEMPNVKALYGKYHNKGFEIVGISLDESKARLAAYIKKNAIPWPQICEGKGWASALAARYGVNAIPATYLLGADGKIIAKNLRGKALGKRLEELLGQ